MLYHFSRLAVCVERIFVRVTCHIIVIVSYDHIHLVVLREEALGKVLVREETHTMHRGHHAGSL